MEPAEMLTLEGRARRAYEWGRLRWALLRAWRVLPVLGMIFLICGFGALSRVTGALLVVGAIALWWRGQGCARAVAPGAGAGLVPLAVTLIVPLLGHLGPALTCWQACLTVCVASGSLAGMVVARHAAAQGPGRQAFLLSAASLAVVVGAPGCAIAGAAGVAGMLLATAVSVPLALRAFPLPE